MILEAKKDYDYIVIDTAPTLLVTDTLIISDTADAIIYVCRSNYTEKEINFFLPSTLTLMQEVG